MPYNYVMPRRTTKRSPNEAATESRYIPAATRRAVYARDGLQCAYCRTTKGAMELDHVKPHSKRGRSTARNLVVACAKCNGLKSDWPLVLFAARLQMEGRGDADKILARVYARLTLKE